MECVGHPAPYWWLLGNGSPRSTLEAMLSAQQQWLARPPLLVALGQLSRLLLPQCPGFSEAAGERWPATRLGRGSGPHGG